MVQNRLRTHPNFAMARDDACTCLIYRLLNCFSTSDFFRASRLFSLSASCTYHNSKTMAIRVKKGAIKNRFYIRQTGIISSVLYTLIFYRVSLLLHGGKFFTEFKTRILLAGVCEGLRTFHSRNPYFISCVRCIRI